jgi:hypothetical protein
MAWLSKLVGIWLAKRTVTSTTPLFMRLLAALAAIAVLAALASALLALAMAGVLWLIYEQLLLHGLSQQMALLSMIGIVLILLAILTLFVQDHIDRIRALSRRIIANQEPVTGRLSGLANAFIRGLLTSEPIYKKY